MKRNFYLQHPLMAMCDPRMEYLLEKEKLKGTGAYWFVIEKLAMLPDSCGDMKYLRPFCKLYKISFAYVKKIIFCYGLFDFEEDGSFMPAELNPIGQRVQVWKATDGNEDEKPEKTVREKKSKTFKSASESSIFESKNDEKQQKTSKEKEEKSAENSAKVLDNSIVDENTNTTNEENIKDITTSAIKEKETAAADDVNFNPIRPWQEVVDGLAVRTPWLEAACIHSGYGELLMRHIETAVDCFKKHIEVYDKWHNLLSESDARRYFVNFTNPGQHTSQALYATLMALDAKQQSAAPPDPYRYEQRIDGRRTYLGCLIPDNAPPRPDNTAFWNETTNSWRS